MPAMPRKNDENKKIAEKILGTPPNMTQEKKKTKIDQRLNYEETRRVK